MKKSFVGAILMGFLLVFITGAAVAQQPGDKKVFQWKFQSHLPAGSTSYKPLKDFLEQELRKLTDGRLRISFFPAGSLVPSNEIFNATRKGGIDGGGASASYWKNMIPLGGIASNCPMTFRSYKEGLHFHFELGFEDMLKKAHARHNVIYYTERMYPTALISKKPIHKLEDYKGLKLRAEGMIADMLKDVGAVTVMIPGQELYLALQTGVVDGAHWGAAGGALTMKLCEVAKYYIQPDLAMSGAAAIIVNKEAYDSLPKDLQTILDKGMKDFVYRRSAQYELDERKDLDTMIKNYNVRVTTLAPGDQKRMSVAAIKQWDKAATDDESVKAIARLKEYLKKLQYID